jgi:iron complex transport system permease protein
MKMTAPAAAAAPAAVPQAGRATGRFGTPLGLAAALAAAALLLLVLGLAAGSQGWSFAWGEDAELITAIRAPRSMGAFLAGALLGLSGAIAQGLFRNPLADPYLLGSAAGAGLGVVLVLAAGGLLGASLGLAATGALLRLGLVADEIPGGGNVLKALPATPDSGNTRLAVRLASEEATELSNPANSLVDCRYSVR